MAVKQVFVCDVCGDEPKNGDTSAWRVITIRPLDRANESPMGGVGAAIETSTLVCHKATCLTKATKL